MRFVIAYVTTKDKESALTLGRDLVKERLAACANVIDGMQSCYLWEGKIEEAKEAILLLKTEASKVEPLTAFVKAHHDYEVPCVLWLPIEGGNPDYLKWLRSCLE